MKEVPWWVNSVVTSLITLFIGLATLFTTRYGASLVARTADKDRDQKYLKMYEDALEKIRVNNNAHEESMLELHTRFNNLAIEVLECQTDRVALRAELNTLRVQYESVGGGKFIANVFPDA